MPRRRRKPAAPPAPTVTPTSGGVSLSVLTEPGVTYIAEAALVPTAPAFTVKVTPAGATLNFRAEPDTTYVAEADPA